MSVVPSIGWKTSWPATRSVSEGSITNELVDIPAKDIKSLYVPLYKGLSIEELLKKAEETPSVFNYFPDRRDFARLPRQWISNVLYTVIGQPIADFVTKSIKERNDKVAENRNLIIELDPTIAEAFKKSLNVSSKSYL